MPNIFQMARKSEFDYDRLREEGRMRARATAVWDARCCTQDYWNYQMSMIPHDAIGADLTKHASHNSYSPQVLVSEQAVFL